MGYGTKAPRLRRPAPRAALVRLLPTLFLAAGCLAIGDPVGGPAWVLPAGESRGASGFGVHAYAREDAAGGVSEDWGADVFLWGASGLGSRLEARGGVSVDMATVGVIILIGAGSDGNYSGDFPTSDGGSAVRAHGGLRFQVLGEEGGSWRAAPALPVYASLEAGVGAGVGGGASEAHSYLGVNVSLASTDSELFPGGEPYLTYRRLSGRFSDDRLAIEHEPYAMDLVVAGVMLERVGDHDMAVEVYHGRMADGPPSPAALGWRAWGVNVLFMGL
jgi:hypothetical protein